MKAKINNTLVKKLVPEEKEYEIHDADLKGFFIRVFPSGTMRYVCQYKRGGKINIGTVGVITPAQAREKAVEILNDYFTMPPHSNTQTAKLIFKPCVNSFRC